MACELVTALSRDAGTPGSLEGWRDADMRTRASKPGGFPGAPMGGDEAVRPGRGPADDV